MLNEKLLRDFLDSLIWTAPSPCYSKYRLTPDEWVFMDFEVPEDYEDLPNVSKGYNHSIDNCVGEFMGYHYDFGKFFERKLKKENINIEIDLIEEEWMQKADDNYDEKQHIIKYKVKKDNCEDVIDLPRIISTESRETPEMLEKLLRSYYHKFKQVCKMVR